MWLPRGRQGCRLYLTMHIINVGFCHFLINSYTCQLKTDCNYFMYYSNDYLLSDVEKDCLWNKVLKKHTSNPFMWNEIQKRLTFFVNKNNYDGSKRLTHPRLHLFLMQIQFSGNPGCHFYVKEYCWYLLNGTMKVTCNLMELLLNSSNREESNFF